MAELRRHPFVGEWVIICPELGLDGNLHGNGNCKYCGSEDIKEVFRLNADNQQGWMIRVVRGKPYILRSDCDMEKRAAGICDVMEAVGVHEILFDSPSHGITFSDLDLDHATIVIEALRMRHSELESDERLRHALIFKLQDLPAKAESHSCWHIVGTPFISTEIKQELRKAKEYFSYRERCAICDYIRDESRRNQRLICQNNGFVAYAPFAARFPYEVWIIPRRHSSDFFRIGAEEARDLAEIFKRILAAIKDLQAHGYLLQIHSAPYKNPPNEWETLEKDYHWHAEIRPKIDSVDDLARSFGFYINHINPEQAAGKLRALIENKCQ